MKPRITKGRIAVSIVLLPVLYLLNAGPLLYLTSRYRTLHPLFGPMIDVPASLMHYTPLANAYSWYLGWWLDLYMRTTRDG